MSGTRTHFDALIGPGNPVHNITTAEIKCYPEDAAPQTVTSHSIGSQFGNWVEFIAADAVSADFVVLGYTMRTGEDSFGARMQIGTGAVASESPIITIPFASVSGLGTFFVTRALTFSPKIPANSRVAIRMAGGSSEDYEIKLVYTQNLRIGGQFIDDYVDGSYFSSKCYSGGSTWTWGGWKQVVAADQISGDFYLRGVSAQMFQDYELIAEVAVGTVGNEVVIAQIPFTGLVNDSSLPYFPLTVMPKIDSNSRVIVRIATRVANYDSYIGVDLTKGLLIN